MRFILNRRHMGSLQGRDPDIIPAEFCQGHFSGEGYNLPLVENRIRLVIEIERPAGCPNLWQYFPRIHSAHKKDCGCMEPFRLPLLGSRGDNRFVTADDYLYFFRVWRTWPSLG